MTKKEEQERQEGIQYLKEFLKPGDTVYTILRHVSRSGMMRHISVIIIGNNNVTREISGWVAKALGWRLAKWGIKVNGCGMDMGFYLVYSLSSTLFPDGFDCIGKGCPSNDHVNRAERKHHPDGGYALRQRWL